MQNRNESGTAVIDGIELTADERQECEVWTRVMGYYRPVSQYNTGKKGEYHERTEFIEPPMVAAPVVEKRYELNVWARMVTEDGQLDDDYPDGDIVREEEYLTLDDAVAAARAITPDEAIWHEADKGTNGLDVFIVERAYENGEPLGEFYIPYEALWVGGTFTEDEPAVEPEDYER